ncbi:DUF1617 family protein [Marinilactibacillus sp. GCM10026970]|uniref:DUF1617 family protein n=1 Tax=Marinilactibacillus sp. GCM10026970 TaxID=3252642 RepID=UPI00361377F7
MKKLVFKNRDLPKIAGFLNFATLDPKPTRGKHKLLDRVEEKRKEFSSDEMEIVKTIAQVDENGEIEYSDDSRPLVKKDATKVEQKAFTEAMDVLSNEEVVIEFAEYNKKYEDLFKALEDYEEKIPAEVSYGYSLLMDAYEENKEEEQ